jgi:hypothetical protein
MRRITVRKLGLSLAAAFIVFSALLAFRPSKRVSADNPSIVGTWIATVTVNTPPGAPPFVFTDLLAINSLGTFTATSTAFNAHTSENPFLPAPLVVDTSDGYGAWKPMGEESNQFAVTFQRFLFAGANTPTGPTGYGSFFPGQNVGVNNVEAVATLHTGEGGDTLTGPFTTQLVTLSGQVAFAGSGTFTATRFKTKPLS